MALIDMVMPRMGESIMECTVITWLKKPGDRIEIDESVLEVATDKVDTEVPALHNGILKETLVNEGDVVAVGAPIARIDVEASVAQDSGEPIPAKTPPVENVEPAPTEEHEVARELEASISSMSSRGSEKAVAASATALTTDAPVYENRFYSPLVLNIAKEEGISRDELDRIPGSGAGNRVTKKDILAYVQQRPEGTEPESAPTAPEPAPKPQTAGQSTNGHAKPATSLNGQSDIIQMDRMRKMIAQRMVESKQISPHVSSFVEADMTPVVQWRTKIKDQFKQQTGENLTYTPLLIEAVAKAIRDFPMINVSVDGDNIIVKRSINIGMAVALPSGNLIVPVIHDADQYNLIGLTKKVNDLSKRARENKLTADDLAGGTYTVSNIGTFGNVMGTPIILQPQVAIMAFGAIVKKPAVIETPQGDLIGIRQLMFLSHSYDHRVVDGSLGGQFVRRVADYLEQFDINRTL
ncbi:2-oxo acid dehydrogenase subunit E2 [Fibrisoma montanum]|uniref:Dihydrolipoamide acetyltransferase component of pyruvate dehydrogenase complex n=1 Tax=Fibrisoma montanum TaxID=2305895 RepID=A0A418M4G8_9BACT|nr:dihydrolipoamide acetyltransferase family protein [Fibrisoma montanum]RIV20648.1 2-oxo acid dehydrogenase subunit E2 [Fibrisoma montanum]